MFQFAVAVGKLYDVLPSNPRNNAYLYQLVRFSSSVGANYTAALRANFTADFLNKLKIVEEEADESIYFLELLLPFNKNVAALLTGLATEGTEILKIIVAFIKTTKNNLQQ